MYIRAVNRYSILQFILNEMNKIGHSFVLQILIVQCDFILFILFICAVSSAHNNTDIIPAEVRGGNKTTSEC